MNKLIHTFPHAEQLTYIDRGEGMYLITEDGRKFLDMTAGSTSSAVLGWSNERVRNAMKRQIDRICHIDYKVWADRHRDELAELLLSRAEHDLDRVYFAGNSGSEGCEAAMKLSYQVHYDSGKKSKQWFITRKQSYHGTTADALSVSDRPNLYFFDPILSPKRAKISQHHPAYLKRADETEDDYARRSARELEDKILEIGPENVCAFIGETIMGGLVGDVPPAKNYWKYVRAVCDKYDIHLILDEVYCGAGVSGKIYCCDWDGVTPDFVYFGKALGAGYAPLSVVVTRASFEEAIFRSQSRVQHGHTHQGYSLGVAAALEVQKIIHTDAMLKHVCEMGEYMRGRIRQELGRHPFFFDVRGRGLRFSFEYRCENQNDFGIKFENIMREKYGIIISGKWHRISFTPALIITREIADDVLEKFFVTFKELSKNWDSQKKILETSRTV